MPQTKSVLQRSALLSGLVTEEELQQALANARRAKVGVPAPRVNITDDQLARSLVELGYVTKYQAEQLTSGRTKLTLGPYIVTDWIAQGGMGQVFKAEHQMMGRQVAIKVLPTYRSTPQAIANFMREIRAQAVLDHDNLVRAFDAGHDGNVYYLVTEFVEGTDLRRLVRSRGRLNMWQTASIISQAAHGLQSAHEKGLIHRDVKPGNILVTKEGRAKVSDLGLAGFLDATEDDPRSYKIVGTADYISPEQIRSPESITAASDIYSLGCTMYYTVTGKVPFPGGNTRAKARRHCEETPWHPRRFNPEIHDDFVDVIADMMEKNPERRIQKARDVVARLEPWCDGQAILPTPLASDSAWMPPPPPASPEDEEDEELQITQEGSYDSFESDTNQTSGSFQSQSTEAFASADQETQQSRRRRFPSLPFGPPAVQPSDTRAAVALALAIAIPVSVAVGALLGILSMLLR